MDTGLIGTGIAVVGLLQAWLLHSFTRIEKKLDEHINGHAEGKFECPKL